MVQKVRLTLTKGARFGRVVVARSLKHAHEKPYLGPKIIGFSSEPNPHTSMGVQGIMLATVPDIYTSGRDGAKFK